MTTEEKRIHDDIFKHIHATDGDFSLAKLNHRQAYNEVLNMLSYTTKSAGCHGYVFMLAITKMEAIFGSELTPYLWEILDQYVAFPDKCFSKDVAFAAFYNIGLHFARRFQPTKLKNLLMTEEYIKFFFEDYPLYFEMATRYLGLAGKNDRQVILAKCAHKRFDELAKLPEEMRTSHFSGYVESGENIGVKICFVSAVCSYAESLYVRSNSKVSRKKSASASVTCIDSELFRDFLNSNPYESTYYVLTKEDLETAEKYVDYAMEVNPSYAKYPYFKARVIFYRHILQNLPFPAKTRKQISDLLQLAKSLEDTKAGDHDLRIAQYDLFGELAENHYRGIIENKDLERQKQDILSKEVCPPHAERPSSNFREDGDYVFISYCSSNFKPVYIDLLEMKKRGINFCYDGAIGGGENWKTFIHKYLPKAACVICYLSDDYMKSFAVQEELELAIKYQKPVICIDITGQRCISKSIINAIRNKSVNQMTSQMMRVLIEIFDDDLNSIVRNKDATVTTHINNLYNDLLTRFPNTISLGHSESAMRINSLDLKIHGYTHPNEDALFADDKCKIYAVADGISRKPSEYEQFGGQSIAQIVSQTFVESIGKSLGEKMSSCDKHSEAKAILKEEFQRANAEIAELIKKRVDLHSPESEVPGCVCLVGMLFQDKFIFGSAGDCMGILVREGQTMIFSQKQTLFAFEKLKVEKDRKLLYEKYVNKSDNDHGYGVVNGDENAVECFKISHIELKAGDVIYLTTDGAADYIQFAKGAKLNNLSLEEILNASDEQDKLVNVKYSDDKAVIRIFVGD